MNYIRNNGKFYGYPDCCIDSFLSGATTPLELKRVRQRTQDQQKVAQQGFIPCEDHAKQILQGEIKIEDLILATRKESRPFLRKKSRN